MPKRRKITPIDPVAELERIRAQRRMCEQRRRYVSKLDQFRQELLALRAAGGSAADLKTWLRGKRMTVAESTVRRWLTVQSERQAQREREKGLVPAEQLTPADGGEHGKR